MGVEGARAQVLGWTRALAVLPLQRVLNVEWASSMCIQSLSTLRNLRWARAQVWAEDCNMHDMGKG